MLELLRPVLPNLPYLFSTFHLEYPTVLSRFCLYTIFLKISTNALGSAENTRAGRGQTYKLVWPQSHVSFFMF